MKFCAANLLFLTNYILILLYMSRLLSFDRPAEIEYLLPLSLASLILMDIMYLGSCNLRGNKIIHMFLGLLALDCWYMLLAVDGGNTGNFLFYLLSPVIWYVSLLFVLMFLFQGRGYRFQKSVRALLTLACLAPLAGFFVSKRAFACMYGIQLLVNISCFLFVGIYHHRQVIFVLKSQWRYFSISAAVVVVLFSVYYFATHGIKNHISNFGIYLPVLLFCMSIHSIVFQEHQSIPLSTAFGRGQSSLILCFSLALTAAVTFFSGNGYGTFLIGINSLAVIFYLCNILRERDLKTGEHRAEKESQYHAALQQFLQEESLKSEFADFLHDEILQNLLSLKNLLGKAEKPEIQSLMSRTLENLNTHIRKEMQDYHPVFLKKLTPKENLSNLIEHVALSFPQRKLNCRFTCEPSLILPEPYNIMICRYLKELLTNVYKHSTGDTVSVTLTERNSVIYLKINDNGTGEKNCEITGEGIRHKGIASIREQVHKMEGSFQINSGPNGFCVEISMPMKGDVSYQYFTN